MALSKQATAGLALLVAAVGLAGCQRAQPKVAAPKPPEVLVDQPRSQVVTDFEEFTGRTEASAGVEVRARVTGYLQKVHFAEGTDVREGDPLFTIDARPYQAELNKAEAQVVQVEAREQRLEGDQRRAERLLGSRAIAREEVEKIRGDRDEARASVGAAKAARDLAQLNLSFTKVTSPLSGRISRRLLDVGNLVRADDTVLTTIVQFDPIHAYFDIDERTLLKLRRLLNAGKIQSPRVTQVPLPLALADQSDFPLTGKIDFADNRLEAGTGTLRVRVRIDNKDKLISPGMFVRLRLPVGKPHPAVLVPERALASDQGKRFLYVAVPVARAKGEKGDDDHDPEKHEKVKVVRRDVKIGQLDQGWRVIESGLSANERVVVDGLQRVRDGREALVPRGKATSVARSGKQ